MPTNPTPSLAGTAETMSEMDVQRIASTAIDLVFTQGRSADTVHAEANLRRAISATYAALAEKTAECERAWAEYDRMRADRAAVLNVKTTDGLTSSEWLMRTALAEREVTALRASLAVAQEDGKRLDWLFAAGHGCIKMPDEWAAYDIQTSADHYGATFREAIDAARPHATPEGTP